jgi:hypothetical protein
MSGFATDKKRKQVDKAARRQINFWLSDRNSQRLAALIVHFSEKHHEGTRTPTNGEIFELALKCLSDRENLPPITS